MRTSYDVASAGGGIVGASCAAECAAAGLSVFVAEPHVIGGGATAAGMGHLVVMDDSPAQIALTNYSRKLWIDLAPQLPTDVEYLKAGTLWVAADAEEMAEVERRRAVYESIGVRAEVLDAHALAEAEPNLRPGLAGACSLHARYLSRTASQRSFEPPHAASTPISTAILMRASTTRDWR